MKDINLGIIGLSKGNGHPYSWSAIINGYDRKLMQDCGFPVIPEYLNNENFPDVKIKNANVSHIYTQDTELSIKIAKATFIKNIVCDFNQMIGEIDGLLLARDDAINHKKFVEPFLKAGIPVYIDKPMALSTKEANEIFQMQQFDGQIFSCSALRYAKELKVTKHEIDSISPLNFISGKTPKDWDRYAIHLIDPILGLPITTGKLKNSKLEKDENITSLTLIYDSGLRINIETNKISTQPITIVIEGENGIIELEFKDTFNAFKNSLQDFIKGLESRDIRRSKASIIEAISLLEIGRKYD